MAMREIEPVDQYDKILQLDLSQPFRHGASQKDATMTHDTTIISRTLEFVIWTMLVLSPLPREFARPATDMAMGLLRGRFS